MNKLSNKLYVTLDILNAKTDSIKELAMISSDDYFSFFRYADLSNLDLSNQDLRGLNFDGSDFDNTNLNDIIFDPGAFNNSRPNLSIEAFIDPYDIYIEDLLEESVEILYLFCRFRPGSIDRLTNLLGLNFSLLAENSSISVGTIRKARDLQVVSMATARSLALVLSDKIQSDKHQAVLFDLSRIKNQPMIECLALDHRGGFNSLSRSRFVELRMKSALVKEISVIRRGSLFSADSIDIYYDNLNWEYSI